jgi:hypothetical protein
VREQCVAFGIEQRAGNPKLLLRPRCVDDDDRGARSEMMHEILEQPLDSG